MFLQPCTSSERHEHDPQVRLLDQGPAAGVAVQIARLLSQLLDLGFETEAQDRCLNRSATVFRAA